LQTRYDEKSRAYKIFQRCSERRRPAALPDLKQDPTAGRVRSARYGLYQLS